MPYQCILQRWTLSVNYFLWPVTSLCTQSGGKSGKHQNPQNHPPLKAFEETPVPGEIHLPRPVATDVTVRVLSKRHSTGARVIDMHLAVYPTMSIGPLHTRISHPSHFILLSCTSAHSTYTPRTEYFFLQTSNLYYSTPSL